MQSDFDVDLGGKNCGMHFDWNTHVSVVAGRSMAGNGHEESVVWACCWVGGIKESAEHGKVMIHSDP